MSPQLQAQYKLIPGLSTWILFSLFPSSLLQIQHDPSKTQHAPHLHTVPSFWLLYEYWLTSFNSLKVVLSLPYFLYQLVIKTYWFYSVTISSVCSFFSSPMSNVLVQVLISWLLNTKPNSWCVNLKNISIASSSLLLHRIFLKCNVFMEADVQKWSKLPCNQ